MSSSTKRHHTEYSVCSAAIACTAFARRERLRSRLGETEVAHLALLDEAFHRADGVFDRHARVDPMLEVEVDRVDLQAAEAPVAGFGNVLRPAVRGRLAVRRADVAELGCEHRLGSIAVCERASNQLFVLAVAVGVGGVEEVCPGVEGLADGGDRLRFVHRPVQRGHRHAAEAERGDLQTAVAELSLLHRLPSLSSWIGRRVYLYNHAEPTRRTEP